MATASTRPPALFGLVAALALVLSACAQGGDGSRVDSGPTEPRDAGAIDTGTGADGGNDAGVDGGMTDPLRGFGEPCTDRSQCMSRICIVVGAGGICSDVCTEGSCPSGFGCVTVRDATEFSPFTDVCVPETTTLCTPCSADRECAAIGSDLCLPRVGSERYCARDCSTVGCPSGYRCERVEIEGTRYDQCLPVSGSCDCSAVSAGMTQGCAVETLFGRTCAGTRTCQGELGWSACAPPAIDDDPDPSFEDSNCDGIDGAVSNGIFVSATLGTDSSTCGLVPASPCRSLPHGIARATEAARTDLFVMAGTYTGVVRLRPGLRIFGGYDSTWLRASRTSAGHTVTLEGALDAAEGEFVTVLAHDLAMPAVLADLVVVGPNATGAMAGRGRGSYAIHVRDGAGVRLERVTVRGGNGATGPAGGAGGDASSVSATGGMGGGTGGAAERFASACDTSRRGAAGTAGANSCSGGRNPNAGAGGRGGPIDTSCTLGVCTGGGCTAQNGENGVNASVFVTSGHGFRGRGGVGASTCEVGYPGNAGSVVNGAAGIGALSGGFIESGFWYARGGGTGGVGDHGTGGGGGGGSGGCDSGTDAHGAGGGGGGAGGCRALGGGTGGGGGGGSFGVFVFRSTARLVDCDIVRGNGGDGGVGGAGGRGQSGGPAGGGGSGAGSGSAQPGGAGGAGAHGGHGGGGGGGAGGDSWGIYYHSSTIDASSASIVGGAAGRGGVGGPSAPTAPLAERDGNLGVTGADGTLGETGQCPVLASCG